MRVRPKVNASDYRSLDRGFIYPSPSPVHGHNDQTESVGSRERVPMLVLLCLYGLGRLLAS